MNLASPSAKMKKKPRGKPFQPGNKLSAGYPHGEAVANLHALVVAHATPTRFIDLLDKVYSDAMAGDTVCMRDYLDRCLGRAHQSHTHEDVTQARVWTDEQRVAACIELGIPVEKWPPGLRAKFENGRVKRVESKQIEQSKETKE